MGLLTAGRRASPAPSSTAHHTGSPASRPRVRPARTPTPFPAGKAGRIVKAADAVAADIRPGDTFFALGHHLIYWYLDRMPIPRIPTNDLGNREPLAAHGYVDQDEMGRILALRPTYIVTHLQHGDPVPPYLRFGAYPILIRDYLADHYRLFYDDRSLSPPGWPTRIYKLRDERDIGGAGGREDSCGRNGPGPEQLYDHRDLGL